MATTGVWSKVLQTKAVALAIDFTSAVVAADVPVLATTIDLQAGSGLKVDWNAMAWPTVAGGGNLTARVSVGAVFLTPVSDHVHTNSPCCLSGSDELWPVGGLPATVTVTLYLRQSVNTGMSIRPATLPLVEGASLTLHEVVP